MKMLSWNVNGLRSVLKKERLWESSLIREYDAIMLQEIKTDKIDNELTGKRYFKFIMPSVSKKGYSGVLTLSNKEPLNVIYGIGQEKFDREGRVLTLEFDDFFLINAYFPNSRRDLSRLDYKMEFNKSILSFMERLRKKKPIVIGGDFNVAHTDLDIARPKQNEGNAGFTRQERSFVDELISNGYLDTFRIFNKESGNYTWWTYLYKSARKNNVGWRIDYFFASNELRERIKYAGILQKQEGSDHVPVILEIN
ncbi:MAG: exodeoxyribonuclease III [Candidatus Parvarchaeum sp.]